MLNFSRLTLFFLFVVACFVSLTLQGSPALAHLNVDDSELSGVFYASHDSIPQVISTAMLNSISGEVCTCIEKINKNRRPTEIEQDLEACFSMGIVNHFEALENELGEKMYEGTDINFETMRLLGLQLGDHLYHNCPEFSKLVQ